MVSLVLCILDEAEELKFANSSDETRSKMEKNV